MSHPRMRPFRMLCLVAATAIQASACVGEVREGDELAGGVNAPGTVGPGSELLDAGPGSETPDAGSPPSCSNITGDRATQVCLRWKCDRADLSEGTWSGAVNGCVAGDLGASARANS